MIGGKFDSEFASFLRTLKQKNDIVEVIRSYVAVDRKGGNYWACCPFHHERTPSFAVNQAEQFYHCFGCGVSGDVVKFNIKSAKAYVFDKATENRLYPEE